MNTCSYFYACNTVRLCQKTTFKIRNNNNNNNKPTTLNALSDASLRSRSSTPFLASPSLKLVLRSVGFFSRALVLFLFFGFGAQNYIRSQESMVATMVVAEKATNAAARELWRGATNKIGRVFHVVKNRNDPNSIGRVVRVVKNIKKIIKAENPSTDGGSKCIHIPMFL